MKHPVHTCRTAWIHFTMLVTKLSVTHSALCTTRVSPSCVFDETRITKRCIAPRRIPLSPLPIPEIRGRETSSYLTRVSANNYPPTRHESRRLKRSGPKASMVMAMLMSVLPFATERTSTVPLRRVSCLCNARSPNPRVCRLRVHGWRWGACIN